jgi:hypothetical protein
MPLPDNPLLNLRLPNFILIPHGLGQRSGYAKNWPDILIGNVNIERARPRTWWHKRLEANRCAVGLKAGFKGGRATRSPPRRSSRTGSNRADPAAHIHVRVKALVETLALEGANSGASGSMIQSVQVALDNESDQRGQAVQSRPQKYGRLQRVADLGAAVHGVRKQLQLPRAHSPVAFSSTAKCTSYRKRRHSTMIAARLPRPRRLAEIAHHLRVVSMHGEQGHLSRASGLRRIKRSVLMLSLAFHDTQSEGNSRMLITHTTAPNSNFFDPPKTKFIPPASPADVSAPQRC